jgi:N6-adenosine-specific RNA methylase IME4
MANDVITLPFATPTGLQLPEGISETRWRHIGERLGQAERAVGWWVGDWWLAGERYGNRKDVVTAPGWTGPSYGTCRNYGSVAARFDVSRRHYTLPFSHYAEVAKLPSTDADAMLARAEAQFRATGEPLPKLMMRQEVKRLRREVREEGMADAAAAASAAIGSKLYGVIYADPPWRFEPFSRTSGMDRAADNHYPTLSTDEIIACDHPAADDCALFLWATAPMLLDAIDVVSEWGFDYKTHWVWVKDRAGTGYWNRSRHELLLLGTRGDVPAPVPGTQYDSVLEFPVAEHSAKPEGFAEMIEDMFPTAAMIEMFARTRRLGWDCLGNEAPLAKRAMESVA